MVTAQRATDLDIEIPDVPPIRDGSRTLDGAKWATPADRHEHAAEQAEAAGNGDTALAERLGLEKLPHASADQRQPNPIPSPMRAAWTSWRRPIDRRRAQSPIPSPSSGEAGVHTESARGC
jgi:hypothetical protein